jgi:uroporphyrinogen-III synthase
MSPSPHSTKVLLLRESSTPDRYESTFISAGFDPISVPVLDTLPVNLLALKDIIRDGPEVRGFAGVVITSKRSCETWGMALVLLKEGGQHEESVGR